MRNKRLGIFLGIAGVLERQGVIRQFYVTFLAPQKSKAAESVLWIKSKITGRLQAEFIKRGLLAFGHGGLIEPLYQFVENFVPVDLGFQV